MGNVNTIKVKVSNQMQVNTIQVNIRSTDLYSYDPGISRIMDPGTDRPTVSGDTSELLIYSHQTLPVVSIICLLSDLLIIILAVNVL